MRRRTRLVSDEGWAAHARRDARAVLAAGVSRTATYPEYEADVFLELVQPPPPLVIFGAGHDAVPMVYHAKGLGWHVTIVDTRAARPRPERFPDADAVIACPPEEVAATLALSERTAAVVMTHNYCGRPARLTGSARFASRLYRTAWAPRAHGATAGRDQ